MIVVGAVLCGTGAMTTLAQVADPMRPPADQTPAAPENSLASAILAAQAGSASLAGLVNVIKAQQDRVSAVLEARDPTEAADLKSLDRAGRADDGALVLRGESGERILSPNPLVQKKPRPPGSPPLRNKP